MFERQRESDEQEGRAETPEKKMVSTLGDILIGIVVLAILAVVGWVAFTQLRARRLGVSVLPSPLPISP